MDHLCSTTDIRRRCPRCRKAGPWGFDRSRPDGRSAYCLPCKARRQREERKRTRTDDLGRHRRRYRARPDLWKAKVAVSRAVRSGRLVRATECQRCGLGPTEGHHYLGYARANWLDVIWLCRSCHKLGHNRGTD